ncbi:MAG: D-aminoacyl-tRNA deacylase, partial [Candidatus Marinimicrobia bacterium]|nr:D-aminoacyl-tRNA deacylase [Candidatus Neomarinimicrobiota bacterium]
MITVLQRVKKSSVKVDEKIIGKIGNGLLIFLGVFENDSEKDV